MTMEEAIQNVRLLLASRTHVFEEDIEKVIGEHKRYDVLSNMRDKYMAKNLGWNEFAYRAIKPGEIRKTGLSGRDFNSFDWH